MFAVSVLFLLTLLYLFNSYLYSFWKRKNVPQVTGAKFLVGNALKMFIGKQSIGVMFEEIYKKYKHERIVGAYLSYRRVLVINDPELVQEVMIKSFSSFHDRAMPVNETADPLTANLFFIKGQKWRDLRVKLSPTFTSGKLKVMFPIIKDCGLVLQEYLEKNLQKGRNMFEFRDLLARFTTTIISSVAFGTDNDCINDPNNTFRHIGMKIFDQGPEQTLKNIFALLLPNIFVKLNISLFKKEVHKFIEALVNQTIEYREKNNFRRNDFMQLLIELKDKGYVSVDKNSKEEELDINQETEVNEEKRLTIKDIMAQVFVFFAAGFETSAATMQFCLFESCKNVEIQKNIQNEIDRVMKKAGLDGITYDLLAEMKYLDCCIDETLRKYPIVPVHFREATKDFKVPNSNIVIEKDTPVHIPVLGIHRDPDYYENPLEFIPERFLNSPIGSPKKISGLIYMPFGDGPR